MAFQTSVNTQITDFITQINIKVLRENPAIAMGNFVVATSQALSNASRNATFDQEHHLAQANTTMGVTTLHLISMTSHNSALMKILQQFHGKL